MGKVKRARRRRALLIHKISTVKYYFLLTFLDFFSKILSLMLKIKLQRVGRKHDPSYRVVVTDRRTGPKSNKHVEILGHYDAIRKTRQLKEDRIKHWIAMGAQPTDSVFNLFVKEGIIEGKAKNVLPRKSPIIDEEAIAKAKEEEEAKAAKIAEEKAAAAEAEKAEAETPAEEEKTEEAPVEKTEAVEEEKKD